jgi:transcription antitermination factor NusA-like protein
VKTAYIYNFCKYVTWPPPAVGGPLDICLLGQDPVAAYLPTLEQKKIQDRKISVGLYSVCADMTCCEVLFISRSEEEQLKNILNMQAGKAVLTISDIQGFARQGGMVELVRQGKKLRFIINKNRVDRAGLVISSRLLKLATIYNEEQAQ